MNPENAIDAEKADRLMRLQASPKHIEAVLDEIVGGDPNTVAYAEILGPRHIRLIFARPYSSHDQSTGHGGVLVLDKSGRP